MLINIVIINILFTFFCLRCTMRHWWTLQLQHCTAFNNIWIKQNFTLPRLTSIEVPWQFACGECHMPATDKKTCCKKVLTSGKKLQLDPATSCLKVSYAIDWAACSVVSKGMLLEFSPLFRLEPIAECKLITAVTCSDKLEVWGWWMYGVRQLICGCQQFRQVNDVRQTDGCSVI